MLNDITRLPVVFGMSRLNPAQICLFLSTCYIIAVFSKQCVYYSCAPDTSPLLYSAPSIDRSPSGRVQVSARII